MWPFIGRLLLTALIAAGGMAAGVGWEHRPRQDGWLAKITGQGLAVQLQDAKVEAAVADHDRDTWKNSFEVCQGRTQNTADQASHQVETDSTDAGARADAAFNNGYRVGRAAGARSCEAPDAHPASPVPGPDAGQLRDLSEDFGAGAYHPGR